MSTKNPLSAVWVEHQRCGSLLYRTWTILNVDINFVHSSLTKKIENARTRGGNSFWVSSALPFVVCNYEL